MIEFTPAEIAALHQHLETVLNARERRVITLRYGLYDNAPWNNTVDPSEADRAKLTGSEPRTRHQLLAARMGISMDRLNEIEARAMKKLRAAIKA